MVATYIKKLNFILLLLLVTSCVREESFNLNKEFFPNPENIQIYDIPEGQISEVELTKTATFGSTDSVFFSYIFDLEVDDQERVYLKNEAIQVFSRSGSYLRQIGRKGSGPGDFQVIHNYEINGDQLYVLDAFSYRISVFDLNSFELISTIAIPNIEGYRTFGKFEVLQDGQLLLGYEDNSVTNSNGFIKNSTVVFHTLSSNGQISEELFRIKGPGQYRYNNESGRGGGFIPNSRSTLFGITSENEIVLVWTDDISVKYLNDQGTVTRGYHYPIDNPLVGEEYFRSVIEKTVGDELEQTMPAVKEMVVSSTDQLWLSTYTEDPGSLIWYILDKGDGDMVGKLKLPETLSIKAVEGEYVYAVNREYQEYVVDKYRYRIKK